MSTRVIVGDALERLRELRDGSVQCCVTSPSPPYWGLRDYGVAGQLGLERTPEEYVAKLVAVFAEVRRVLANDGVLWLNLGDSYATGGGAVGRCLGGGEQGARFLRQGHINTQPNRMPLAGYKPKDLVGIPWMVAFALRADGWYLRSDIIWAKPNAMPESVTDRPTKLHEYLFLLAKSERYYYDAAAIAEPCGGWNGSEFDDGKNLEIHPTVGRNRSGNKERKPGEGTTRNKRTVWTIPTAVFKDAHFATFPPALIEPCILAGSRLGDTILDPFGGAGTTGLVAERLQRHSILVELNPAYAAMARERITADAPLLSQVTA